MFYALPLFRGNALEIWMGTPYSIPPRILKPSVPSADGHMVTRESTRTPCWRRMVAGEGTLWREGEEGRGGRIVSRKQGRVAPFHGRERFGTKDQAQWCVVASRAESGLPFLCARRTTATYRRL